MTLFFDLKTLETEAACDSYKFIALLEYHYKGSIPSSKKSKYKPSKQSLHGTSFILNPEPIFTLLLDINYLIQYVKLCGYRDYAAYKLYGVISLDTSYFPDLQIHKIKTNPLLKIVNNQIQFKFEEEYNGIKLQSN